MIRMSLARPCQRRSSRVRCRRYAGHVASSAEVRPGRPARSGGAAPKPTSSDSIGAGQRASGWGQQPCHSRHRGLCSIRRGDLLVARRTRGVGPEELVAVLVVGNEARQRRAGKSDDRDVTDDRDLDRHQHVRPARTAGEAPRVVGRRRSRQRSRESPARGGIVGEQASRGQPLSERTCRRQYTLTSHGRGPPRFRPPADRGRQAGPRP